MTNPKKIATPLKGKTGLAHPRSKAIIAHDGVRFDSMTDAASYYKISRQAAQQRVKRGVWTYAN